MDSLCHTGKHWRARKWALCCMTFWRDSVMVINFIKSRPRNARLFRRLCENMGAEHTTLLLHTQKYAGCWNYDLKSTPFWSSTGLPMPPCSRTQTGLQSCAIWQIYSANWTNWMCLCRGKETSILNMYDKVGGFLKKAELWRRSSAEGDFTCFPQVDAFLSREDVDRAPVKSVIVGHLTNVIKDFHSYFPDMEDKSVQLDWVRNPFLLSEANRSYLSLIRKNSWKCHVTVASRWSLPHPHSHSVVCEAGAPDLGQKALEQLLPFASTYLCEASFSAMTDQNKSKKQTVPGEELHHSTSLPPRLTKILSEAQAQVSH